MAKTTGVRQRCLSGCPPRCRTHKWQYMVEFPGPDGGKRIQITQGGFHTAREAAEARAEVVNAHRAGTLPSQAVRKESVPQYLERWYTAKVESGQIRLSTAHSYRGHIDRYLIPHLGSIRLRDLRRDHIEAMLRKARETTKGNPRPVGASTERRIVATLRSAVRDAVKAGEIPHDHTAHVRMPKAARPRGQWWTPGQWWDFVDRMEAEPEGTAPWRLAPLVKVTTGTGLRLGEVCGLRWEDVDTEAGFLSVRQQAQQVVQAIHYVKPKTRSGEDRVVPLAGWVPDVLRTVKARQAAERLAYGRSYTDTGLVFTHPDGTGLMPHSVSKGFGRLVKSYGAPRIRFHDLRHIGATILLRAGVPMPVVSRILGHSSIGITVDTYGHVVMDAQIKDAMDRALATFQRASL